MNKKNEMGRLKNHVIEIYKQYCEVDDSFASVILSSDKWSIKEIFGHLIDSAANNYQRFIRLQETDILSFPGYDYNWIKIIKYNSFPFTQIIELWKHYNLLLCHIIENIDEVNLNNNWVINGEKYSLLYLIKDYVDHMEVHITQLKERYNEVIEFVSNQK